MSAHEKAILVWPSQSRDEDINLANSLADCTACLPTSSLLKLKREGGKSLDKNGNVTALNADGNTYVNGYFSFRGKTINESIELLGTSPVVGKSHTSEGMDMLSIEGFSGASIGTMMLLRSEHNPFAEEPQAVAERLHLFNEWALELARDDILLDSKALDVATSRTIENDIEVDTPPKYGRTLPEAILISGESDELIRDTLRKRGVSKDNPVEIIKFVGGCIGTNL